MLKALLRMREESKTSTIFSAVSRTITDVREGELSGQTVEPFGFVSHIPLNDVANCALENGIVKPYLNFVTKHIVQCFAAHPNAKFAKH
jgi:methionine synthase I (cobalamin-dependent)